MGPGIVQPGTRPTDKPTNGIGCTVCQPPRALDVNSLYGSPLLQELVNLATATVAYHLAVGEGLKFIPPHGEFRTTANIEELIKFSLKDTAKPHIVMFAREVLRRAAAAGPTSELDFAKIAVTTYVDMQGMLAGNSSWSMPTREDVLKKISDACSRNVTFEELMRLGKDGDSRDITNASMGARPTREGGDLSS